MADKLPRWVPWRPVDYAAGPNPAPGELNKADLVAIQAWSRGEAEPEQQRRAFEAVMVRVCQVYDQSYRSDSHGGERDTAFAEGKRFVGLTLRKIAGVPLAVLTGETAKSE
jgi:hypothetical protein